MPASRPLPDIGANCHELRIVDRNVIWRVVYYVASDAIVILEVFAKKTRTLPKPTVIAARRRLRHYVRVVKEE